MKSPNPLILLLQLFLPLTFPQQNTAYQINDAINLSIRTINPQTSNYEQKEALRSQMPLFGTFSSCTLSLPLKSIKQRNKNNYDGGVSLSFADGSMSIPWYNIIRHGSTKEEKNILRTLIVNFVYTSDGGNSGEIHSVSSHPVYVIRENDIDDDDDDLDNEAQVEVMYIWLEEANVDIQGGTLAMFIGTLIATMLIVILACFSEDEENEEQEEEEVIKEKKEEGLYGSGDDGNYYQKEEDIYRYQTATSAYRRGAGGGGGGKWD